MESGDTVVTRHCLVKKPDFHQPDRFALWDDIPNAKEDLPSIDGGYLAIHASFVGVLQLEMVGNLGLQIVFAR